MEIEELTYIEDQGKIVGVCWMVTILDKTIIIKQFRSLESGGGLKLEVKVDGVLVEDEKKAEEMAKKIWLLIRTEKAIREASKEQ